MPLSLDSSINPLSRMYALFDRPDVLCQDDPTYLGISNLRIKDFGSDQAQALIQFLRQNSSGALRQCRLNLAGHSLINFAEASIASWFNWVDIEERRKWNELCEACYDILLEFKPRIQQYYQNSYWSGEDPVADCLAVLDDLADCKCCVEQLTLEVITDKAILVENYLLDNPPEPDEGVSGLVWYDPANMEKAFSTFQTFLEFIHKKASHPIVLFFYQPTELYNGYYFKIISFQGASGTIAEREGLLCQQLSEFTPTVSAKLNSLCRKHLREKRTALGERFNMPPSMFLQSGEKTSYPSHPVFTQGLLRSLLIYAVMSWLAEETEQRSDGTRFALPLAVQEDVAFNFSPTQVEHDGVSVFSNSHWGVIIGCLAHEIEQSAGNETYRGYWLSVLKKKSKADFTALRLFDTLEAVCNEFVKLKQEPPKFSSSPPSVELLIFVEKMPVKQLRFLLNCSHLFYSYKGVGTKEFGEVYSNLPLEELDQLARGHLSRTLEEDPAQPEVLMAINVPESCGAYLWDKVIPDQLKEAYLKIRSHDDWTIFIISDAPTFPWELIRPDYVSDDGENQWTDPCLALKFSIARWITGHGSPSSEIALKRVLCVAANSELAASKQEVDCLGRIAASLGGTVIKPSDKKELLYLLSTEDYDVLHFACHGRFNVKSPDASVILLPDGSILTPNDLYSTPIKSKIRKNQPLIFINACHSGQTGETLVGLGGWAEFFTEKGCGAFIGCGWEVSDELAADFAVAFYTEFSSGKMNLGQAFRHARKQIMEKETRNSSWLAYYLYGNPNCNFSQ